MRTSLAWLAFVLGRATGSEPTVCAKLTEQCSGGAGYSGPDSCCSPSHMCELLPSSNLGVCVRDPARPFSVGDLKPCSSVPPVERNVPRRDCPGGTCEFQTPHEIVQGGVYHALRPRSDYMILHSFFFPPGESVAKVTVEIGKGYGGVGKLWQMCYDNGAPAGCPDLRFMFGLMGIFNPYTGAAFNWDDPAEVNTAFLMYNATVHPMCNTPGVKLPDNDLHILDICLQTDMSDENYWYFHAMMDFTVTSMCQLAPPSCRLVKMGKPDGNDPTYWEESWDTWGALAYNESHINLAAWASCPTVLSDPNKVPCNFGSIPGSSNCDAWWAPNIAPAKQDPPMTWPPEPLEAHPDGPSVIARFCGPSCKFVGDIPEPPPSSRHTRRRSLLEESTELLLHGRAMQSSPNMCPTDCVACRYEGEQCAGGTKYTGPTECCTDDLTCETLAGTPFGVCVKVLPDTASPPPPPQGTTKPNCTGRTISFSIYGQPNVAVGFIDTTTTTIYPIHVGDIHTDVSDDGDAPSWVSAPIIVDCSVGGQLEVTWAGGTARETLAPHFMWKAADHSGQRWYTALQLVDIMYETVFDGGDVLTGQFNIHVNNAFLEQKFEWKSGESSMASLVASVKAVKRATGACPMMHEGHSRNEDLGGAFLLTPEKRRDYMLQTVVDDHNGVPDYSSQDLNQLTWLMKMQQKDDMLYLTRHMHSDVPLLWDHKTCLSPQYIFETVPAGVHRAEGYQYETCHRLTMSDYGEGEFEGSVGARLHTGLHPSGGVDSSLFEYPPMQGQEEHRRFKSFMNKILEQRPGYGTENGYEPPELSSKWQQLAGLGKVNVSHVYEMVFGLGTGWISGLPTSDHTSIAVAQILRCKDNTLFNREMNSRRGGIPSDPYTRRFKHCEGLDWSNPNNGHTADLQYHYYQAPIYDEVRKLNVATNGAYLDMYSPRLLSRVITENLGFLASQIEMAARLALEDEDIKAQFRADPEKAVLEFFRLATPSVMSTTLDTSMDVNASFVERPSGVHRMSQVHAGVGLLERYSLYTANRDPSAFKRPNTFDAQRDDWMKSLAFGAPLDIWYDDVSTAGTRSSPTTRSHGSGSHIYNHLKPLGQSAKYYCPAYYAAKEIAKKVIAVVVDSDEANYKANREQCRDNEPEVQRILGERIYAEHSVCKSALARLDGRFEKGVGCMYWSGLCCKTCAELKVDDSVYTQLVRMTMMRTLWFPDQFRFTGIATYRYFVATQRYWDDRSVVEVTPTGKKNHYDGPEAIMEYYSLQNEYFNPPSYRLAVSVYNLTKHYYPKWDKMLDDGRRIHSWNFDPALTLGVPLTHGEPPYDFSQFVWHDTTSIYPIYRAFHDFRKPTGEWRASGKPSNMVDAFEGPAQLCHLITERCIGNYSQFDDFKDCYEYMVRLPMFKVGWCPLLAGNTLGCRWVHAILSHEKMRPDIHCFHLGKAHIPDPHGKLKCHDSECGYDRAGPLICDGLSCDGSFQPAGQIIDWMHAVYWWCLLVLAFLFRLQIWRYRLALVKTLEHGSTLKKATPVRVQLMQAQKDTLQTLDKLYPIVTGAVFVFFFFALVFTITAGGQPAFLWRPWPMESLAPRYSELQQERGIQWARYWYSDYAGESSEYQFSSLNIYMLQFLLFYILLTGTLIFVLALEWIGTRLHAMPNRPLWMSFDLPQLGHGAFVVFVTVALTFPSGPFSYILFCFGVTKCMYPEIHYTLWAAFSADPPVAELKLVPETYWRRPQMHYQAEMSTRGEIKSLHAAVAVAQLRKRWADKDKRFRARDYKDATAATNTITKATHDHLYDLDLNQKFSAKFFVHFSSGCGLMLHHFSLVMIYCGSSLHLMFTEALAFQMGLISILFLVLLQHLVAQIVPSALFKGLILLVIEVFFQWFAINSISDAGSSLGTVGTLGLMVSHFLMAPEVPYSLAVEVMDAMKKKKSKSSKLLEHDDDRDPSVLQQIGKCAETGTKVTTEVFKAVAPKFIFDGMEHVSAEEADETAAAINIQRAIRKRHQPPSYAGEKRSSFRLRKIKDAPTAGAPSTSASHASDITGGMAV